MSPEIKTKFIEANGLTFEVDTCGEGDKFALCLHGYPEHAFSWRYQLPLLAKLGYTAWAPNMRGYAGSSRPTRKSDYRIEYLLADVAGLIDASGASSTLLVVHDWGSALGFHWAKNHPGAVKGIAYMEGIVMPVTWEDWPENARGIFQGFRSEKGEGLVLERNSFVEAVLPSAVLRGLTEAEMEHYRAPFQTPDDRQPTLNWPRPVR